MHLKRRQLDVTESLGKKEGIKERDKEGEKEKNKSTEYSWIFYLGVVEHSVLWGSDLHPLGART